MGKTRRRKPTSKTRQARRMHREFSKRYEPPDDLEEDFNIADFPELASSLAGTQDITNPEIEQIKAEAEAIINSGKAQPSSSSRPTFSVDAPRTDDPDAHNLVWWIPAADKYIPLADHGLRQRGLDLRAFALVAPMAMNAMAVLVKKTQSLQWFIEAGRNLAIKWQSFFNNVEMGRGWDYFVARLVRAYSESDRGAYVEIIRYAPPWAVDENHQLTDRGKAAIKRGDDKYWEIADLHVLDPVQCSPTTSQEFPLIYDNPRSGTRHQLRQYNFMHVIDMPGVDSSKPGLGYCAISRSVWAAKEDTMISRYAMEKMSDNPGAGLVAANVAANVLKSALKKANAQREARGIVYYKGLIFVPLLDPSGRFSLEFLNFSELIDNFNRMENYNILKETVAAAFGIDPLELGSLPGHQLGSGKQAGVLSEKARGKGMGAIIIGITRELRHKVLPSHVRFRFQPQDITEEAAKAEVHQTYFRNAFVMAKAGWDTDMINQYLIYKEAIPRSLVEKQAPNIELSDTEAAKAWRYGDIIRMDNTGNVKVLAACPYRVKATELVVPAGNDAPLVAIPASQSKITDKDIKDANADWNKHMPNQVGLLKAKAE